MREQMNDFLVTGGRIVALLAILLTFAAMLIWVERRLLGLWQDRYGPNRVGAFGLLQVMADIIKMFMKEDWIPAFADKTLFVLAPAIIMITILMSFVVVPITPSFVVCGLEYRSVVYLGHVIPDGLQRGARRVGVQQ